MNGVEKIMKNGTLLSNFVLAAGIALAAGQALADHTWDHYPNYPERLGETQSDGTIYAGRVQLQEYKPMYVSPTTGFKNAVSFDDARNFCTGLRESGHSDWRMADRIEMWQIFSNKRTSEKFNEATGNFNAPLYWVAQPDSVYASPKTEIINTAQLSNSYVAGNSLDVSVICIRP